MTINSKASTKGNKGSDFFVLQQRQHLRLLYARHTIAGISTKTILFLYNLAFNYLGFWGFGVLGFWGFRV